MKKTNISIVQSEVFILIIKLLTYKGLTVVNVARIDMPAEKYEAIKPGDTIWQFTDTTGQVFYSTRARPEYDTLKSIVITKQSDTMKLRFENIVFRSEN